MINTHVKFDLTGILEIELDNQMIKVECKGQFIKLTFFSLKALRKFITFNRKVNLLFSIQDKIKPFSIDYYICDILIGKSRSYFNSNWLDYCFNIKHVKIFPTGIFSYFLKSLKV